MKAAGPSKCWESWIYCHGIDNVARKGRRAAGKGDLGMIVRPERIDAEFCRRCIADVETSRS